jgi:hypothetical protein
MKLNKAFIFAAMFALAGCDTTDTTNPVDTTNPDDEDQLSIIATCPPSAAESCPSGTTADGTSCVLTGDDMVTVSGAINDFQSKRPLKPGAVLNIVDNATGKPTGACTVAGADGAVSFVVPRGEKIGVATSAKGQKDTYQYHLQWPGEFATGVTATADTFTTDFLSVSEITSQLIPGIIGVELDLTKGIVAGTVYKSEQREAVDYEDVEMRVRISAENEAFYFDNGGLPTSRENQDALNAANGLFVVFDVPTGTSQTLEFEFAGEVSATTNNTFVAFPNSVAISSIICTDCE